VYYERNGKKRLHPVTEPVTGWVSVEITGKRCTTAWIDRMVELADDYYPDTECIRVVVDHLNTHNPAGFYRFFHQTQPKRTSIDSSSTTFPSTAVG
jgi:hypothetical protein